MTRPTCAQRRSREKSFLWKRRKICRRRETEYRAPFPGSPLWARSSSRTYTLGRSAPSVPAGCRAYTLRRHLVRGLRPMDKRRVNGRRRADSRFSPFRNFAGGHRPSPRRRNSRGDTPRAPLFSLPCASRPHPHFFVLVRAKTFSGGKMANFDDPFDVASAEWMLEDPTGAAEYPGTQNLATAR